jgi:hypothetical protein
MLIKAIKITHLSKTVRVLAVLQLKTRDIVVIANSCETRKLIGTDEGWTKVSAGRTKVKGILFTARAYAIRTNKIKVTYQEKALPELQA